MPTQTDDLLNFLFDGQPHLLTESMSAWLTSSRRFAAFVHTFRDKIRKKLRTTQGQKSLLDLQLELETAYLLLEERALSVVYEPEQSKGIRSPDFAVRFTTSLTFMVEVTRLQGDLKNVNGEIGAQGAASPSGSIPATSPLGARLADAVASKLGQLLPRRANILLIAIEAANITPGDIRNSMLNMQQRVERNDPSVLQGYGFLDRAEFFRHYRCLSEVLVRLPQLDAANSMVAWINPQAKHPLPGRVRTVLHRSLTGSCAPGQAQRGLTNPWID
jgi:hypothetical protein